MSISIVSRLHVVFDVTICECEAASAGGLVFIWANHFEKRLPGLQRLD
jgi:hypothetical protein